MDPVAKPTVMKARICRATSSPTPTRPTGNAAAALASIPLRAASGIAARIGVSMMPGDTTFTLTGANSRAKLRPSDSSAPFTALTIAAAGRGRTLKNPETSVSDPPARISAARATRHAPQNFPSIVARTFSIGTSLKGPMRSSAAVTTTWSTGPHCRKSWLTLSSLVTLVGIAFAPSCSAAVFRRSGFINSSPALLFKIADKQSHEHWPSRRLISRADGRLALAETRQFPHTGTGGIDIGGDVDVDQIWPVCVNAPAYRLCEISGPINAYTLDSGGPGHGGKVGIVPLASFRIVEIGREFATAEISALQPPDRCVSVVIPHDPDHRQVVFHRSAQDVGMHEEGAVTAYRDARPIGCGEFCSEDASDTETHWPESHRADQRVGTPWLAVAQKPVVVHADVTDQNGVFRQAAIDLDGRALRIDRFTVVGKPRRHKLVPLLAIAINCLQPFLAGIGSFGQIGASVEFRMDLLKESTHVSHQAERYRIVATNLFWIDVHVYELRRRNCERVARDPRARGAIVEAHAEGQQQVSLSCGVIRLVMATARDQAKCKRMISIYRTEPAGGRGHGNLQALGELQ